MLAMVYLVIIIVFITRAAQLREQAHAEGHLMAVVPRISSWSRTDEARLRQSRQSGGKLLIYAALIFWAFVSLFPDLLDDHDLVQGGAATSSRGT